MRCGWPRPAGTCRFRTLNADTAEVLTLRRCALLAAILVAIAALRTVATYPVLSHTVDEPIHLGAGMEFLDHGTMTGDVSHPPMARVLAAIGPWLAGEGGTACGGATHITTACWRWRGWEFCRCFCWPARWCFCGAIVRAGRWRG